MSYFQDKVIETWMPKAYKQLQVEFKIEETHLSIEIRQFKTKILRPTIEEMLFQILEALNSIKLEVKYHVYIIRKNT